MRVKQALIRSAAAVVAVIAAAGCGTAFAQTYSIDFTSLPPNTAVTNQFADVTFSLAGGPDSSGSPTTTAGAQGTSWGGLTNTNNGGAYPTAEFLVATFDKPVTNLSFAFFDAGYNGGNAYTVYGAGDTVLASGDLSAAGGLSYTYDLGSLGGIEKLVVDNGSGGNWNWWQDMQSIQYTVSAVPEPATWTMLILGLGMIGFAARRRNQGMAVAA